MGSELFSVENQMVIKFTEQRIFVENNKYSLIITRVCWVGGR